MKKAQCFTSFPTMALHLFFTCKGCITEEQPLQITHCSGILTRSFIAYSRPRFTHELGEETACKEPFQRNQLGILAVPWKGSSHALILLMSKMSN